MSEPQLIPTDMIQRYPKRPVSLEIITYCAEEVARQGRGPIQVAWMVEAWLEALTRADDGVPLTESEIQRWGSLIEREKNRPRQWRQCGVRVGPRLCPPVERVPSLMSEWLEGVNDSGRDIDAADYYKRFQEIHPFADGNGRVGKILFNWINGTLKHPQMPPNFWNIANP